jgi:hypothetical protein
MEKKNDSPSLPGRTCSAQFYNFVEEKTQEVIRKM